MVPHRSDLIHVHELLMVGSVCAALTCPQARRGNPPTRSLLTGRQMAEREETLGRGDKERELEEDCWEQTARKKKKKKRCEEMRGREL